MNSYITKHLSVCNTTSTIIVVEEVPLGNYTLPLSKAEVVEEGKQLTVYTYMANKNNLFAKNDLAKQNSN